MPAPLTYRLDTIQAICTRLCGGMTLRAALREEGIPAPTYYSWLQAYPEAKALHDAHLGPRADALVDEAMDILDGAELDDPRVASASVTKAWRRAEFRRWLASKIDPSRYGDKSAVDLNHSGEVKLTLADLVRGLDDASDG